jgi:hypothetical protein
LCAALWRADRYLDTGYLDTGTNLDADTRSFTDPSA